MDPKTVAKLEGKIEEAVAHAPATIALECTPEGLSALLNAWETLLCGTSVSKGSSCDQQGLPVRGEYKGGHTR